MDDQSLFNILQNIRAKELMKNKLRSYAGCCFSAIFEYKKVTVLAVGYDKDDSISCLRIGFLNNQGTQYNELTTPLYKVIDWLNKAHRNGIFTPAISSNEPTPIHMVEEGGTTYLRTNHNNVYSDNLESFFPIEQWDNSLAQQHLHDLLKAHQIKLCIN